MKKSTICLLMLGIALFGINQAIFAQKEADIKSWVKISNGNGGFGSTVLKSTDGFSDDLVNIGDLDGDGVQDLAAGANKDDDVRTDAGAVYIMFMNSDHTVKSKTK
jgi:hypothetical protein